MAGIIEIAESCAWLVLAIAAAVDMRKWNRRFSELYDKIAGSLSRLES